MIEAIVLEHFKASDKKDWSWMFCGRGLHTTDDVAHFSFAPYISNSI